MGDSSITHVTLLFLLVSLRSLELPCRVCDGRITLSDLIDPEVQTYQVI